MGRVALESKKTRGPRYLKHPRLAVRSVLPSRILVLNASMDHGVLWFGAAHKLNLLAEVFGGVRPAFWTVQ